MATEKSTTVALLDPLTESHVDVTVDYYVYSGVRTNHNYSIEGYDLEGENISREELVERFGESEVIRLEESIDA